MTKSERAKGRETTPQFDIHPSSKWLEAAREDEVSIWDVHRSPRTIDNKHRQIRAPLELLNTEFRCAICLGYLKNTTVVSNCLHRFCGDCIHKCIRVGLKECPSCRKPIPSRRNLKYDEKFDAIVQHVLGDDIMNQSDETPETSQDALKMVHLQRAIERKRALVDQQKKTANKKAKSPSVAAKKGADVVVPTTTLKPSPLIEFELRRHPHETSVDVLNRSFLVLRADCKVALLKKFLNNKLQEGDYQISSTLDDDSVDLGDEMALLQAQEMLCHELEGLMVLKYRCVPPEIQIDKNNNTNVATQKVPSASAQTNNAQSKAGLSKDNTSVTPEETVSSKQGSKSAYNDSDDANGSSDGDGGGPSVEPDV